MAELRRSHANRSSRAAAFFDVDGTVVDATIVHYYAYFRKKMLSPLRRKIWVPVFLAKCLYFLLLDRIDRGRFNVVFYRSYAGIPAETLRRLAAKCYEEMIRPRCFDEALACIDEHSAAGREVVLVTGSIDFIVAPLVDQLRAQHLIAASLEEADGLFTGRLTAPPISDMRKALLVKEFAGAHGIDLSQSFAYGDSAADLPLLETVGFPRVVNADRKLAKLARRRGWPVLRWQNAPRAAKSCRHESPAIS